jgi:CheY-like chemotaxis protein
MSGSDSPPFDPGRVSELQHFHDLMPFRVHDILLVSSLYDSFILAEDGQVSELILSDFLDLNLHHTPDLARVDTGGAALRRLKEGRPFNLIVTSLHLGDMNALELARRVKKEGHDVPVVLLAYNNREIQEFVRKHDVSDIERIFLWQGDVRILLAIVKYIEDKRNVAHDTETVGVQSIIVIEDNIRFYSSFLPVIYTELVKQTQKVLSEGINVSQKLLRMRARPKILLCDSYEEAWDYFSHYQNDILGVISDIQFPRGGELSTEAGVEFARQAKAARPDLPIMLQSSFPQNRELAESVGADFLLKGSPTLLNDLLRFMKHHFAFGDFVFCLPEGKEVGRASDLRGLEKILPGIPAESLAFHAKRDHFSNWLKARTEFSLAALLRPRKVSDFPTIEAMRHHVIESIRAYRHERDRGIVAEFDRDRYDASTDLYRIGGGSLGGKARGLAFANYLLTTYPVGHLFHNVKVWVPPAVVLGTDVFDRFMEDNDLRDFAMATHQDAKIRERFLNGTFPEEAAADLDAYLELIHYPVAVRSSSLLEDSPYLPFAGIYHTYMLPNNEKRRKLRLEQLITAVKLVFASTFSEHARAYLAATPFRLEEEKMAVIIQKIVGSAHGERFYPDFSGVMRSHNFYPTGPMSPEDGIASIALGLGRTVVEGGACLSFCPRYPRAPVGFASNDDMLNVSAWRRPRRTAC